jgi:SSS family solute:Na+ symporter
MRIHPLDLAVVISYLLGVTLFGLHFRRRQTSLREYLLSSRALPWWALAGSIVATETSTLTIISTPGIAYSSDLGFLQLVLGYLVARIVICVVFIPQYFRSEFYTAYQLVEKRFGPKARTAVASVFLVTRALAEGVRINAIGKVVSVALGTGETLSVAVITGLTLLYTFEGGLRAVIWTDLIQLGLYATGSLVAFFLLLGQIPHGWTGFVHLASAAHKLRVFHFQFDLQQPYTFWAGLLGGTFLTMASHGTDQTMVQRLLAARSARDSKLALLTSGVVIFIQFALFLLIGAMLYVLGMHTGFHVPQGDPDRLFPAYVVGYLPRGLSGLVLASIFAVAMSNASGALNSLASSSVIDFGRHTGSDRLSEARRVQRSRWLTLFWGLVLGTLGLLHWGVVLEAGLTVASITYGGMLGLFLLAIFSRRATPAGAVGGLLTGMLALAAIHFAPRWAPLLGWNIHTRLAWTWYVLVGTAVTLIAGLLMSRLEMLVRAVRQVQRP